MKMITAIVQPGMLEQVTRAVTGAGARGLTACEVRGFGQQYGHMGAAARPAGQAALVLPKLRVDVLVQDENTEPVIRAIAGSVKTGAIGDGKIWVTDVQSALRIRTGELDHHAI